MPPRSSNPPSPTPESDLFDDSLARASRRDSDELAEASYLRDAFEHEETFERRKTEFASGEYLERIHLGPEEEVARFDTAAGSAAMRDRLDRVAEERDNALSALEHERSQRDERLALLTEEQDRFVARMLREHEEEVFLLSRESRRFREEFRRAQQELGKARREIGRLRGELESTREELHAAREDVEALRRQSTGLRKATDRGASSRTRSCDGGPSSDEIERLLVEYSREMEHKPSGSMAVSRRSRDARATEPSPSMEERLGSPKKKAGTR